MNRFSLSVLATVPLFVVGCAPDVSVPAPSAGRLNVQHYVAVGDSYSAGFSDGGLTRTGQENSFPNLLAQVFQRTAAAPFAQPLLEAGAGTGYLNFVDFDAQGLPLTQAVAPAAVRGTPVPNPTAPDPASREIRLFNRAALAPALPQNLAVPGLQLAQIRTARYGSEANATPAVVNAGNFNPTANGFNPYFERLLPANDSRTYLNAVSKAAAPATFFTYFAGLDVLVTYLRQGLATGPRLSQTTLTNSFNSNAKLLLDSLTAGGRKGVIIQLPSLNSLPLLKLGAAVPLQARLRTQYGDTNSIYVFNGRLNKVLKAADNDYILATALPRIGQLVDTTTNGVTQHLPYGRHPMVPVKNKEAVDYAEYNILNGVLVAHNEYLTNLARTTYKMPELSNTSPLLDISQSVLLNFSATSTPIAIAGVRYSPELVRGGVFSLDYYSLTPRGYGLLANAVITALNYGYGASLPAVDVNNLPTTAK